MKSKLTLALFASALILGGAYAAPAGENWAKNCAACHGKDGAGHTKAGRMARVKDLTDPQYQKSFTDAQAQKQIKEGLTAPDGKVKMKAFGDVLSADEITSLVAYVRSLSK
jgi:mono/diheme cytochrome c family protein